MVIALAISQTGCDSTSPSETAILTSPDDDYVIELQRFDAGACCSTLDKARIVGLRAPFLELDEPLFEIRRAIDIEVSWISQDEIQIRACDASDIDYRVTFQNESGQRTITVGLENLEPVRYQEYSFTCHLTSAYTVRKD
ncbi:MAG: hypothetical protein MRY64_09070 [Hyphomonadaceae bacterium]|nr:hypothetical protein [Hyphomonadaceae bacterium]